MRVEITIPGDIFAALSPNVTRRLHYQEQARRRKEWKGRTIIAWRQAGCPQFFGKVKVQITLRRGRVADPDNCMAACKSLIDGLKSEPGRDGCIRDDSARFVELLPIQQVSGAKFRQHPDVLVQIELCGGILPFEDAA